MPHKKVTNRLSMAKMNLTASRDYMLERLPIPSAYLIRVFDFTNKWIRDGWLRHVHTDNQGNPWYWIDDIKTPCRSLGELIECIHASYHMLVYIAHLNGSISRISGQEFFKDPLPEYDLTMVYLWTKVGRKLPYPIMPASSIPVNNPK